MFTITIRNFRGKNKTHVLNISSNTQNDDTGLYTHLTGVPKALLPGTGGKKILDFWWETVNTYVTISIQYSHT